MRWCIFDVIDSLLALFFRVARILFSSPFGSRFNSTHWSNISVCLQIRISVYIRHTWYSFDMNYNDICLTLRVISVESCVRVVSWVSCELCNRSMPVYLRD